MMTTPPNSTASTTPNGRADQAIAAIDNTLTYYSAGLGEDITIPVEHGDPATHLNFEWAVLSQAFGELGRQPQARWDMWDRKTHRTGRSWTVRGGRS